MFYDVRDVRGSDGDTEDLRITGVAVQLAEPGEQGMLRWVAFHHFLWLQDPGFYGTEAIQLWPAYQGLEDTGSWLSDGEMTGRLLYDSGGKTYTAPYYFLGGQTYTADTIIWGEQTKTDVFAAFSMPRRGERCRGYVIYPVLSDGEGCLFTSMFDYIHQQSWLKYPAMTAMEAKMKDMWGMSDTFHRVQDAMQFYPDHETGGLIQR